VPTRFKFFEKIRRVATQTTGFRPDKWNPGDIYLIDPKQEQYIDEVLSSMNPSDVVENLKTINNLFVTEWGDRSQPIVSVSLKYANAQHGKAKDFLKSRLRGPAVGETQGPWLTTGEEQQWDAATLINASNQLRQNITQAINSKGTDVDILYQAQTQPELQAGQQVPEKEMRRVQMKYSALKILDFMFSTADTDQLDDIIVGAIGYAMSLAGVNPVFFKIEANKDGAPIEEPFKFSAGGAVALYPHQGQTNPTINISDLTSNAALIITCNIEVGEDIKAAQLEIKPSGRSQATIELTKAKTIDLSM
jgi:hypothetical protein